MKKAFTLIELMIVLLIIAILASLAVVLLTDYIERAKWAEAARFCDAIKAACEFWRAENGDIPRQYLENGPDSLHGVLLNGPNATSAGSLYWIGQLGVDIPPPKDGFFIYQLYPKRTARHEANCIRAFYDEDGNGILTAYPDGTFEPYVVLRYLNVPGYGSGYAQCGAPNIFGGQVRSN